MNARLLASCALLAFTLGGCASDVVSTIGSVNLNPFRGEDALNSADYNYFYKREANNTGYVSPNDLVGPDGRCAFDPAPANMPGPAAAPEPPQAVSSRWIGSRSRPRRRRSRSVSPRAPNPRRPRRPNERSERSGVCRAPVRG